MTSALALSIPALRSMVEDAKDTAAKALKKANETAKQQGPKGDAGRDGKDGADGRDGVDGKDGRDGVDGKAGAKGKDGQDAPRLVDVKEQGSRFLFVMSDDSQIVGPEIPDNFEPRIEPNSDKAILRMRGFGITEQRFQELIDSVGANVRLVTENTTITDEDKVILVDATAGDVTVTVPTTTSFNDGREFRVKRINTAGGNVIVEPTVPELLDGEDGQILNVAYYAIDIHADQSGGQWVVL
ncbi:MAG: hypothetical protein ACPHER_05330 [Nevskiales bacterium]